MESCPLCGKESESSDVVTEKTSDSYAINVYSIKCARCGGYLITNYVVEVILGDPKAIKEKYILGKR